MQHGSYESHMSCVTRIHVTVFEVADIVRHKQACVAIDGDNSFDIWDLKAREMLKARQQKSRAKGRFSYDAANM